MRYHIASLVAVFLALTIGLLLGSLIADKGVLANQQERLVKSIRSDVGEITERNAELQAKVQELDDFQTHVLPTAVKDRLVGKKVAIVTLSNEPDAIVGEIGKTIQQAGGKSVPINIKLSRLKFSDKDLVGRLGSSFGENEVRGGNFERLFWSRLALELTEADSSATLVENLKALGILDLDTADLPLEYIVFTATGKKVNNRDSLFLESLVQLDNLRVIGVESSTAKPSRMAAYKLRSVSTVDNIDTVPGKIALIHLLSNSEVNAHYGTKSTADRLLP